MGVMVYVDSNKIVVSRCIFIEMIEGIMQGNGRGRMGATVYTPTRQWLVEVYLLK